MPQQAGSQEDHCDPAWRADSGKLTRFSKVSLTPTGTDARPAIGTGANGIVNSADGTPNFKPASFITISGKNPADAATADTIPPPPVPGGPCVTSVL